MPRKRNPLRDRARELWEADKSYPLKSIAEELGVPEARVRKWKCKRTKDLHAHKRFCPWHPKTICANLLIEIVKSVILLNVYIKLRQAN